MEKETEEKQKTHTQHWRWTTRKRERNVKKAQWAMFIERETSDRRMA